MRKPSWSCLEPELLSKFQSEAGQRRLLSIAESLTFLMRDRASFGGPRLHPHNEASQLFPLRICDSFS